MAAAGGKPMDVSSTDLQYLIREHMIENAPNKEEVQCLNNGILEQGDHYLHLRWNSQFGTIFVDGSHLTHKLELGDEVFINGNAPPLALFTSDWLHDVWSWCVNMIGCSDESSSIGVNIMVGCQFTATAIAHQYQALHVHRTDAVQQYSHLPRDTLSTSSTDRQHHGSSGRPPMLYRWTCLHVSHLRQTNRDKPDDQMTTDRRRRFIVDRQTATMSHRRRTGSRSRTFKLLTFKLQAKVKEKQSNHGALVRSSPTPRLPLAWQGGDDDDSPSATAADDDDEQRGREG